MTEVRIDWAAAEVADGALSVRLDGEPAKGWKKSFESTVRLLGGGDWGSIKIKKGHLRMDGVTPGSEDRVRHFLDSAVTQANADHREPGEDTVDDEPPSTESGGPDAEMTSRFRSFASHEPQTG